MKLASSLLFTSVCLVISSLPAMSNSLSQENGIVAEHKEATFLTRGVSTLTEADFSNVERQLNKLRNDVRGGVAGAAAELGLTTRWLQIQAGKLLLDCEMGLNVTQCDAKTLKEKTVNYTNETYNMLTLAHENHDKSAGFRLAAIHELGGFASIGKAKNLTAAHEILLAYARLGDADANFRIAMLRLNNPLNAIVSSLNRGNSTSVANPGSNYMQETYNFLLSAYRKHHSQAACKLSEISEMGLGQEGIGAWESADIVNPSYYQAMRYLHTCEKLGHNEGAAARYCLAYTGVKVLGDIGSTEEPVCDKKKILQSPDATSFITESCPGAADLAYFYCEQAYYSIHHATALQGFEQLTRDTNLPKNISEKITATLNGNTRSLPSSQELARQVNHYQAALELALLGYADAQFKVGILTALGRGTEPNCEEASLLFGLSRHNGFEPQPSELPEKLINRCRNNKADTAWNVEKTFENDIEL